MNIARPDLFGEQRRFQAFRKMIVALGEDACQLNSAKGTSVTDAVRQEKSNASICGRAAYCINAGMLLSLFAILTLPLILFAIQGGYDWDEKNWHIPAVLMIRETWPAMNVNAVSLSAVPPGYHYFLATVSLVTGAEITALRLVNWSISAFLLLVLYCRVRPWVGGADSLLLIGPLATSNFYVKASCWVVTDNAALLLVVLSCLGLFSPLNSATRATLIGILAAAATFVRQTNVWLAAPMWIQAVFVQHRADAQPRPAADRRTRRTVTALALGGLMPVMVVSWLWSTWGGLVPPRWQVVVFQPASSSIAYLLAVAAMAGIPYIAILRVDPFRELRPWILTTAIIAGITSAVVSPNTFSYDHGRWGGYLWELVKILPAWTERSSFFLLASPLGAIVIASVFGRLWRFVDIRSAVVWLSLVSLWAATFILNRQVFHRYYEPMLIVLFVLAAARLMAGTRQNGVAGYRLPLMIFCAFQVAVTLATAWKTVLFL